MTKQLKRLTVLFVLLGLVFFMACEKDQPSDIEVTNEKVNKLEVNWYRTSSKEVYTGSNNLRDHIFRNLKENTRVISRTDSELYNFSIDEERVQVLSTDEYTSYTFIVEREEKNPYLVENYVFTEYEDGSYLQMLMAYPAVYTSDGITYDFTNTTGEIIQDEGLLMTSRVDAQCDSFAAEIVEWVEVCVEYNCTAGGNHSPGESCNGDPDEQPYTVCSGAWVVTGCTGGGSTAGNGGTGETETETTGGGPSGGSTGNGSENPFEEVPVVPMAPTVAELIEDCLNKPIINGENTTSIEPGLIDLLGLSKAQLNAMNSHLQNNNCSESAQEEVLYDLQMLFEEAFEENPDDFIDYYFYEAPDDEVTDMVDFLSCFDRTQNAELTIYADQPITDSSFPVSSSLNPGHAFVSLTQGDNTVVFGFYPKQKAKSLSAADGAIGNNQGDEFDASLTLNISADILNDILNYCEEIPSTYNLNFFNCTDYVIAISNFTNHPLPDCWALYPGGGGSSPSVLGQYIKSLPQSDEYDTSTELANAPSQSEDCN